MAQREGRCRSVVDSKSGQPIGRVAVLIHRESYARAAGWLRAGRRSGMFSNCSIVPNRARNCFTARRRPLRRRRRQPHRRRQDHQLDGVAGRGWRGCHCSTPFNPAESLAGCLSKQEMTMPAVACVIDWSEGHRPLPSSMTTPCGGQGEGWQRCGWAGPRARAARVARSGGCAAADRD